MFGLSIRTQERDLDEEFSRFGRVDKVTIVYDQRVSLAPTFLPHSCLTFLSSQTAHVDLVSSRWLLLKMPLDASRN